MTLSGPDALRILDEAVRDIRREEDDIARKLGRGAERVAKLREAEADLLRQFAKGRLETDTEAELSGRVTQAIIRAQGTAKERGTAFAALAGRLRGLDKELTDLVAERASLLAEADRHQSALRGLSARIATAIAKDPEYERHRRAAAALEATAAAAAAKARQADMDRELKARPYRADPLFMYLWNRSLNEGKSKPSALIARLDHWVAGIIDFPTARANYVALNALPSVWREHARQVAVQAVAADDGLDRLERAGIDAAGGTTMREALDTAQARMMEIDGRMIALQDQRDSITRSQAALIEATNTEFDRAVTALSMALGGSDIQSVIAAARVVPLIAEDALLSQLDDVRLRVAEEEIDTRDQTVRLKTLAMRRRELEDIEYEFKTLKFDDPRSMFRDDDLVGARLNDFLTGGITAQNYWGAWIRNQGWTAGTADWGGGVGLPRRGRLASSPGTQPGVFSRPRQADAGAGA